MESGEGEYVSNRVRARIAMELRMAREINQSYEIKNPPNSTMTRKENLYRAKLAEQAQRYEEMIPYMDNIAFFSSFADLSAEERSLLSFAYKNVIVPIRAALRIVSSIEQREESRRRHDDPTHVSIVKDYRSQLVGKLLQVSNKILNLLRDDLIPTAASGESRVFYQRMLGDYHRYAAEFIDDVSGRKVRIEEARRAYTDAQDIAFAHLSPAHPIRLGLQLNLCVFYYDIENLTERARTIAKQALQTTAVAKLDSSDENFYKEEKLIVQLLRDNLTLWTSDMQSHSAAAVQSATLYSIPRSQSVPSLTFSPPWTADPLPDSSHPAGPDSLHETGNTEVEEAEVKHLDVGE